MREEGAKEMSGEERLLEKRWRRVGMSGSSRRRESEEMTQSNTSSPRGLEVLFECPRVDDNEVPQNEDISGGGKNGGRKKVDSAILWRRANRGSINIKK